MRHCVVSMPDIVLSALPSLLVDQAAACSRETTFADPRNRARAHTRLTSPCVVLETLTCQHLAKAGNLPNDSARAVQPRASQAMQSMAPPTDACGETQ